MIFYRVKTKNKINSDDFLRFTNSVQRKEIFDLADKLREKKIIQFNATGEGGGVAEIFNSLIPYCQSLGVKNEWYAINSDKVPKLFFVVSDKLRDAFQGAKIDISKKEWDLYESVNKKLAKDVEKIKGDLLMINDFQLLSSIRYLAGKRPVVYYSHIDTSTAYKKVWDIMQPVMNTYGGIVFSHKEYAHKSFPRGKVRFFVPAIDPFSLKQKIVSIKKARKYLSRFGVSEKDKLIVQVSRFDVWKNPLGLIEAFVLAKKSFPKMKLLLVGFQQAKDNPSADIVYKDVSAVASGHPDIFLFYRPGKINITEFTAMAQNAADIVIQNSTKEGFGLTLTEAMWKAKPVIGGSAHGIKKQIQDRKNGFIINSPGELTEKILFFLSNPVLARKMGKAAKKTVKDKFLMPRLTLDHLRIYNDFLNL